MADQTPRNYIPINPTPFPKTKDVYPLGDNCHHQVDGAIPVWVLTDMLGKIIVGNSFYLDEGVPVYSHSDETGWCVVRGRITINRSYQSSTATINLSSTRHNMDDVMPALPKEVARFTLGGEDGIHPVVGYLSPTDTRPLDKGDVVCVWAGYLPELRAVTSDDLEPDKGLLIRRFVGKIDTLVGISTFNQGEQVVINMRDFMAYLMDSMGTYNVSDFNPIGFSASDGNKPDLQNQTTVNRPRVILELSRRCIGHLEYAESLKDASYRLFCSSVGGMKIKQGYVVDYSDDSEHPKSIYEVYKNSSNALSYPEGDTTTPFIGGKTRTQTKDLPMGHHLKMNIVSGRAPFILGADNKNWLGDHFQITDRVPVEFIKMLSLQEPWPTEFFVDSRTGEYWYAPRGTDLTGLSDPKRFYRTYCVRRQPVDLLKRLEVLSESYNPELISMLNSQKTLTVTGDDSTFYTLSPSFITSLQSAEVTGTTFSISTDLEKDFLDKYGGDNSAYTSLEDLKKADLAAQKLYEAEAGKIVATILTLTADIVELTANIDAGSEDPTLPAKKAEKEKNLALTKKIQEEMQPFTPKLSIEEETEKRKAIAKNALGKVKEFLKRDIIKSKSPEVGRIHLCQAALLFREESSVINFRTNVIVSSQPLASGPTDAIGVHIAVHPSWLKKTRYACSYFQAVDSTIGKNTSELVATAMSYARYYGKELRAASLHVLGDPSIVPGEAIQVIGSTLYGGGYDPIQDTEAEMPTTLDAWEWDRKVISSYLDGYDQLGLNQRKLAKEDTAGQGSAALEQAKEEAKNATTAKAKIETAFAGVEPIGNATLQQMTQAQLMCPYASAGIKEEAAAKGQTPDGSTVDNEFDPATNSQVFKRVTPPANPTNTQQAVGIGADASSNTVNFPEDPKTIWRVEAVIDKLYENPGEGYKTEIALISPF